MEGPRTAHVVVPWMAMLDADLRRTVSRLQRRISAAAFFGELARHAAVALVGAGVAALLARQFLGWSTARSLLVLLLLAPAIGTAWWFARRRFVSAATAATWLDVKLGASGRYVTAFEIDGAAPPTPPSTTVAEPVPRLRRGVLLRPLLPALAFAALAFWIPLNRGAPGVVPPVVSAAQVERIAEKLAALEETVALEPELSAELHERLEHAREQADSAPLASTYEAMDQLAQRITNEAEAAREHAERARAPLESDAFSQALQQDPGHAQE